MWQLKKSWFSEKSLQYTRWRKKNKTLIKRNLKLSWNDLVTWPPLQQDQIKMSCDVKCVSMLPVILLPRIHCTLLGSFWFFKYQTKFNSKINQSWFSQKKLIYFGQFFGTNILGFQARKLSFKVLTIRINKVSAVFVAAVTIRVEFKELSNCALCLHESSSAKVADQRPKRVVFLLTRML